MKLKLFLIITAMLASYPAYAFAESDAIADTASETALANTEVPDSSDIIFTEDDLDSDEFVFDEPDFFEEDTLLTNDAALLNGEAVPWDGVTQTEPPVAEDGAYEISNGAQLAWLAEQVNTQKDNVGRYIGMANKNIRLMEDIDLSGFDWTPIGNYYYCPFAGSFDGNGHTVRGLSLGAAVNGSQGGLFGCVIGSVSNLKVDAVINTARNATSAGGKQEQNGIGIVAGTVARRTFEYNNKEYTGSIENCSAFGTLTVIDAHSERFYVGGIAGRNNGGIMSNNISCADITALPAGASPKEAETVFVGAITGYNDGEILNTENPSPLSDKASVTISIHSANPNAGIVVGGNSGSIHDIDAESIVGGIPVKFEITKSTSAYEQNINIGGIAGRSEGGTISSCSAVFGSSYELNTNVSGAVLNYGSIAGSIYASDEYGENIEGGIITDCTASFYCNIDYEPIAKNIGGIVGNVLNEKSTITDCTSTNNINITNTDAGINLGGTAGISNGVIDSCSAGGEFSIISSAQVNAGGIAGVSNNTVTDCISSGSLTSVCTSSDSLSRLGGISGASYGNVIRSKFTGSISNKAVQAYSGGIAGYAGFLSGTSVTAESDADKTLISKCDLDKSAVVSGTYISGGIIGSASNVRINAANAEGTVKGILSETENISDDNVSVAVGGIVGTASTGLEIENSSVTSTLSSDTAAGAVYAVTGADNRISTSYLSPSFSEVTNKYQVSSSEKPEEITTYAVYINKDITGADTDASGVTLVSAEEAKLRSTFTAKPDEMLNFDTIWNMGESSPVLQHRYYSNSYAKMTDATTSKLTFHTVLENPQIGQKVYVALYNKDNRFCGTALAVCTEEYINATETKAEFMLEYSYNYWYNPKNYDENGDPKPDDEWIPADDVPVTARTFTWNEENGMKSLSSVSQSSLQIYFEE
ncbi:MAG: GLUG motif-containing protein [bacterium]|nr:GLUG motif-containing protein [bacterium]